MTRHYTKDDVELHSSGYGGRQYPAVNVKCYAYIDADKIRDRFHCSEATAKRAIEFAWESNVETFWEDAKNDLEYYFPDQFRSLKVYSAGRSGGWLIVEGLPDVDSWDAIMLGRWRSFEKGMRMQADYLTSWEGVVDIIEPNEWAIDADTLAFEINAGLEEIAS